MKSEIDATIVMQFRIEKKIMHFEMVFQWTLLHLTVIFLFYLTLLSLVQHLCF